MSGRLLKKSVELVGALQLRRAKRVGRPKSEETTKQLIAIRLDPKLISRLKKLAKTQDLPYQSLIHQLLEEAVDDVA